MTGAVPVTVHRYTDPREGFSGFVTYHGSRHRLAAGGFRVQRGLNEERIVDLAGAMELKERLLGLAVDGAKAGIDYDPAAPGKREAMRRFLRFLRPHLDGRLSLGPDLGTAWSEIETLAREEGITSVKLAVARAQGLSEQELVRRLAVLDHVVDGLTVGERRSGHALAHAALAAARTTTSAPLRVAVQGFGTLGRGAVLSLARTGASVVAVADEHGCAVAPEGVDVDSLLAAPRGVAVPAIGVGARSGPPEALFGVPADLLVLAATEDAMDVDQASTLVARAVAVGANLGLASPVEELLHRRGVVVVPDFVGGCGGSASMDALFGPPHCPAPGELLERLAARMAGLVTRILELCDRHGCAPREAALSMCRHQLPAGSRPYGHWSPDGGGPSGWDDTTPPGLITATRHRWVE